MFRGRISDSIFDPDALEVDRVRSRLSVFTGMIAVHMSPVLGSRTSTAHIWEKADCHKLKCLLPLAEVKVISIEWLNICTTHI